MKDWIMENRDTDITRHLRYQMVQQQLVKRKIKDLQVLEAMLEVPRHFFVPLEYRDQSYSDRALPIGYNQTISQPYMVAVMTEALTLQEKGEKILEIGTGSGYQTAILCHLKTEVHSIERIEPLARGASHLLRELGYQAKTYVGDGSSDIPQGENYDGILVAAAAPAVPTTYLDRLKPGGILVIPIGDRKNQILKKFTRQEGKFLEENITRCIFVPLIGAYGFSSDDTD